MRESTEAENVDRLDRVPGLAHYDPAYLGVNCERLYSYRMQLESVLSMRPQSVLVVGVGDGLVVNVLRAAGLKVDTLDIQAELSPDIVGSVTNLPCEDDAYDVSVCCQVLEHLPFSEFRRSLNELRRVSTRRLVLSLPDVRRFASFRLRFCRFGFSRQFCVPRLRLRPIPPERFDHLGHYWEIGFVDTPFSVVAREVRDSGWRIERVERVYDLPWHTFFLLTRD